MENSRLSPLAWIGVALVAVIALVVVVAALTATTYGGGGYYGMMGLGGMGWEFAFMIIPTVLLLVLLFAALGGLEGRSGYVPPPSYVPPPVNALELLDQRYARGELSREEYLRIRADLTHGPAAP